MLEVLLLGEMTHGLTPKPVTSGSPRVSRSQEFVAVGDGNEVVDCMEYRSRNLIGIAGNISTSPKGIVRYEIILFQSLSLVSGGVKERLILHLSDLLKPLIE